MGLSVVCAVMSQMQKKSLIRAVIRMQVWFLTDELKRQDNSLNTRTTRSFHFAESTANAKCI